MNINIIAVGKIREKYISLGIDEFMKRLAPYSQVKVVEVDSEDKILSRIKGNPYIIVLEISGKSMSSEEFAEKLREISLSGVNEVVFIIGGAEGLTQEVKNAADLLLSFSKMTFPHQLMRLILLEQIYRAFRILNREPYHK
jgi:23S rRNA (pseudouridine1915-N3)-methyltransferase